MKTQEFVSRIWSAINEQGHEASIQIKLALPGDVPLLDFRTAETVTEQGERYVKISVDEDTFQDWLDEHTDTAKARARERGYFQGADHIRESRRQQPY
jgi:hypothetical protein